MGWLFKSGCSRRDQIAERTGDWQRTTPEGVVVKTTCLAHCYRGGAFSGVLWTVWGRSFTKDGAEVQPTERWIGCDMLRSQRDYGWGYKDIRSDKAASFRRRSGLKQVQHCRSHVSHQSRPSRKLYLGQRTAATTT